MNIFVTSNDPFESAKYLDDKRVNKMILESVQMLSTALILKGIDAPVKISHVNHPCSVWCRSTRENYLWLCDHLEGLLNEKSKRYHKEHSYRKHLDYLRQQSKNIPSLMLTPFVNCAANKEQGLNFHNVKNTQTAYKMYLLERWKRDNQKPTRYKQPIELDKISF